MKKYQVNTFLNIAISCVLIFIILFFAVPTIYFGLISQETNQQEILNMMFIVIGSIMIFFLNLFLSIKTLRQNNNNKITVINNVVTTIIFWVLIYFPGYFFANYNWFILLILSIIIFRLYLNWQSNRLVMILVTLLSIFVFAYSISLSLKENYCWDLANQSPVKEKLFPIEGEIEKAFVGSDKNASISGWLRIHLQCDENITFWKIVKIKFGM